MTKKCKCGCGMRLSRNKTGKIFKDRKHYAKWQIGRKRGEMKMKKVYLKTPEAVIKALKEGKEVKDANGYSYKLVEGFIIATTENEIFVGDCIFLNSNPYIVEEKPFEIEVGKWYETHDHQKARCFRVTDRACNCNSFTIDNGFVFNTYKDGKYGVEKECSLDIIGPWRD